MTRQLFNQQIEKEIFGKRAWKHGEALIATLGDRLGAMAAGRSGFWVDFPESVESEQMRNVLRSRVDAPEYEKESFKFSSGRAVVSWVIDRLGKETPNAATETCVMHDNVPPRVPIPNPEADGCRFRDEMVSSWMSDGYVPIVSNLDVADRDRDKFFHPVYRSEYTTGLDAGKSQTVFRLFSAFPEDMSGVVFSNRLVNRSDWPVALVEAIDSIADRYAARGKSSENKLRVMLAKMAAKSRNPYDKKARWGTFSNLFSRTRTPFIAREVVIDIAYTKGHDIPRDTSPYAGYHVESRYSKLTKSFMDELEKIKNPTLGDAAADLINDPKHVLPVDINRCVVSREILSGKIPANAAGKEQAKIHFDKNRCKDMRP
jgi:hypothetical protein